jgi:hypothetical protein
MQRRKRLIVSLSVFVLTPAGFNLAAEQTAVANPCSISYCVRDCPSNPATPCPSNCTVMQCISGGMCDWGYTQVNCYGRPN